MNNIEKKHKYIIDKILKKSKYDIYYDNIDSEKESDDDSDNKPYIYKKLLELQNLGPITNYKLWKKLIQHICGSHNIIKENNLYAQILIDILDEKFILQSSEYNNIFISLQLNKKTIQNEIYIKLCERFGIYNLEHLLNLLYINKYNPMKNIGLYFKNYILSNTMTKYNYSFMYTDNLLDILCNKNILSQLYINNDINNKLDDKIFEQFIQKLYLNENLNMLYNMKRFEYFVKNNATDINNKDEIKERYIDFSKQIYLKSIDIETKSEKYIDIYENIYKVKYNISDKEEYYIDISKDLIEFETKLKSKLQYLNLKDYKFIDEYNSIHQKCNYIEDAPTFIEYMVDLYNEQREQLNFDNYIDFANLIHFTQFIDLQNPNSKKMLYNIFKHRILHNKDIDLKLFVEIDFDENIIKNAMYTLNYKVIKCMLDNKYNARAEDLVNIHTKFTDKNNLLTENVKNILELFVSYNIFMDKDILIKFIRNNDFSEKFKYITLKPYTIYKDEPDKKFNEIITEILKITKQQNRNYFYDNLYNEIEYIDMLEKNNKQISIDDIFKFANYNVKFLLNKYIDQNMQNQNMQNQNMQNQNMQNQNMQTQQIINDNTEKPKKIVKKIIKKVIVKK